MQWVEKFANNQGVRLHYLDSGGLDSGGQGVPALFVPGFGEEAAEHTAVIEALAPRRTLVVDLRGFDRIAGPATFTAELHDAPDRAIAILELTADGAKLVDRVKARRVPKYSDIVDEN